MGGRSDYIRAQGYPSDYPWAEGGLLGLAVGRFGYTPTLKHLHKDDSKVGLVWFSDVKLDDGRTMAIGLEIAYITTLNYQKF